jgi:hypothetical protein
MSGACLLDRIGRLKEKLANRKGPRIVLIKILSIRSVGARVPRKNPLQVKLRVDYFSLSLFHHLPCFVTQIPLMLVFKCASTSGLSIKLACLSVAPNRTAHIGHQCRKITVLCCHRCLVLKKRTTFKYRLELLPPDVSK